MSTPVDLAPYFRGERLYGDDFGPEQLAQWVAEEKRGCADLRARPAPSAPSAESELVPSGGKYTYNALNQHHGFRHLRGARFERVLGFGAYRGAELLPLASRIGELTITETADPPPEAERLIPATFVCPDSDGTLPLPDDHFDLVTCFGVLHHIANVSKVVGELSRVLRPGGQALIREPIVSMGDWSKPRQGLTANERGIPLPIFRSVLEGAGFEVVKESLCVFRAVEVLAMRAGLHSNNTPWLTTLDAWASSLFRFNLRYHATTTWQKLRPASAFYVLRKP